MSLDASDANRRSPSDMLWHRAEIAGCEVDLMEADAAMRVMMSLAGSSAGPPLGVLSANLDHIHHFGARSGVTSSTMFPSISGWSQSKGEVAWLSLLDGSPLVARARVLTGRRWPRLAGSDLIEPILDECERRQLRVGFLGGSSETQTVLRGLLDCSRPELAVSGFWSPAREELTSNSACREISHRVRDSGTDVLVVGLGKPRQEEWIGTYGAASGARLLLAFGAVVDFLAGRVKRAPGFCREHGLEWAWRLMLEPRRLGRRYLVHGPPALLSVASSASVLR